MRLSNLSLLPSATLFTVLLSAVYTVRADYFIIDQPSASATWNNGVSYPVSWTKGLLDGIYGFDVELTRLSEDGLIFVAQNVPTTTSTLNILLQDVPAGDDYFLLFLNSTIGQIYCVSSEFSIAASNSTASQPSPDSSAPTVTVSGGPNPTVYQFATTFPAIQNGALDAGFASIRGWRGQILGISAAVASALLGAAWTLL